MTFISKVKAKVHAIGEKISNNKAVRFIGRKVDQMGTKVDSMPKKLTYAAHLIPVVNVFAHCLKEKGLNNRLPELKKFADAEQRHKTFNKALEDLIKDKKSSAEALTEIKKKREEFLKENETPAKGVKQKMQRKMSGMAVSESRIKGMEKDDEKMQKKIDKLQPIVDEAKTEMETADANLKAVDPDGSRTAEIKKDRADHRKAFLIGMGILTAATVALVALSIFGVLPLFVGAALALTLGISVGAHVGISQGQKWKQEGQLSFKLSTIED